MKTIMDRVRREPALLIGLVSACIALALAFGFTLTDEQVGAIMAVVVAVLALVTRQAVTPNVAVAAKERAAAASGLLAGAAARIPEGTPVEVVRAAPDDVAELEAGRHRAVLSDRGAVETGLLVALACVVIIICGIVWLAQAF